MGRTQVDSRFLGRTDNAYLTLAFPWGDIWVGRFKRNWGSVGQTGMMIGDNATPIPQIALDLGRGNLSFRFMAGELLSVNGRQRYIVGNRLDYRRGNFWVSIGESALYSGESAVLRLFNPLEAIVFDHSSTYDPDEISGNVMFNGMLWWQLGQTTLYGEFALDDFDLNPRTGAEDRPVEATSYQLSLGGRYQGNIRSPRARLRLSQSLGVVVPVRRAYRDLDPSGPRARGSLVRLRPSYVARRLVSLRSRLARLPRASVSAQGRGRLPHSIPSPRRTVGATGNLPRGVGDDQTYRVARPIRPLHLDPAAW